MRKCAYGKGKEHIFRDIRAWGFFHASDGCFFFPPEVYSSLVPGANMPGALREEMVFNEPD